MGELAKNNMNRLYQTSSSRRKKKKKGKTSGNKSKMAAATRTKSDIEDLRSEIEERQFPQVSLDPKLDTNNANLLDYLDFNVTIRVDHGLWTGGVYVFNFKIPDEYPHKP